MRRFQVVFGDKGSVDNFLTAGDNEEKLLEVMLAMVFNAGEIGQVFELRDHEGTVLHRASVEVHYAVRPND